MDLFEYQARDLFAAHGVPVLDGLVAATPAQARAAALRLSGPVVVKAQVKAGGRGKAGGVAVVSDPDAAATEAERILGLTIKGHPVRQVLLSPAAQIAQEFYVSILVDRGRRTYLAMASAEGGMEIEQLAVERPDALTRLEIDPLVGVDAAFAARLVAEAGFPVPVRAEVARVVERLWQVFRAEDALLVEVNPLACTSDGRVLALDGKLTLDDNARFRHPGHQGLADTDVADPIERRARELRLSYVRLDGQVGIIGNGAGLVMSTLDVVAFAGEEFGGVTPANFLDIGGGASAEVMANGLQIVLSDPRVRVVFVNVFGGITACDAVATGIRRAFELLESAGQPVTLPLVVRLDGNNAELGHRILDEFAASLPPGRIIRETTMEGAARRAAELAAAGTEQLAASGLGQGA